MSKKIFITGGAGYVGSKLVPDLLALGYKVTVYDIMYFTDSFLPKNNKNLSIIKGDIRDVQKLLTSSKDHDIFIHLACISNDITFELDEKVSKSINFDCFEPMVLAAKKNKIKRFIYASTSSVYGLATKPEVKEDHPLVPITLYNKFKGLCEPILLKHASEDFETVIFRPATVCGYAPRQRFDLTINILTNFAINKNFIKIFGGEQLRPNIHIQDYCDAVKMFMTAPKDKIDKQIFNLGYQNLSITKISEIVQKVIKNKFDTKNIEIKKLPSNDPRSYHINSGKIEEVLGFKPRKTIENAIEDLCDAFENNLYEDTFNNDIYHNISRLKKLGIK